MDRETQWHVSLLHFAYYRVLFNSSGQGYVPKVINRVDTCNTHDSIKVKLVTYSCACAYPVNT